MSNETTLNVNLGMFGCALELIGFILIIFIFTHWNQIFSQLEKLIR